MTGMPPNQQDRCACGHTYGLHHSRGCMSHKCHCGQFRLMPTESSPEILCICGHSGTDHLGAPDSTACQRCACSMFYVVLHTSVSVGADPTLCICGHPAANHSFGRTVGRGCHAGHCGCHGFSNAVRMCDNADILAFPENSKPLWGQTYVPPQPVTPAAVLGKILPWKSNPVEVVEQHRTLTEQMRAAVQRMSTFVYSVDTAPNVKELWDKIGDRDVKLQKAFNELIDVLEDIDRDLSPCPPSDIQSNTTTCDPALAADITPEAQEEGK